MRGVKWFVGFGEISSPVTAHPTSTALFFFVVVVAAAAVATTSAQAQATPRTTAAAAGLVNTLLVACSSATAATITAAATRIGRPFSSAAAFQRRQSLSTSPSDSLHTLECRTGSKWGNREHHPVPILVFPESKTHLLLPGGMAW
jgi:hypothetical protein